MSLSGKIISRVFQLNLRKNVLNSRQLATSYILRQPAHTNKFSKSTAAAATLRIERLFSTKAVCSQIKAMGALSPLDPSSFSRPELAIIRHISLALNVDFEKRVLNGEATLTFDVLTAIDDLILDASNLKIHSIESEGGSQLQYKLGENVPNFGSKLTILLPKQATVDERKNHSLTRFIEIKPQIKKIKHNPPGTASSNVPVALSMAYNGFMYNPVGPEFEYDEYWSYDEVKQNYGCSCTVGADNESCQVVNISHPSCSAECRRRCFAGTRLKIKIKYTTDPSASALQWLDAAQTSGKKHPYMFSQCQPIHARSILPCQDTPAVKFTYDAEVTAPEEFTVLMSALRGEVRGSKTIFRQPMPLPSYLVAIAVGVLESRTLGPRSKVWSEKEEIERSVWEFAETEKYLQAAERLCGPYEWTQYDLLVLPPSFPYGGMENPCLTFVTPTLLAGDRSQADVIVHEIMHSWTGNLVTNRNFEHFWLNEGFTVYLERKVAASLINDTNEAKRSRDFHSLLGLQELSETIEVFGPSNALTKLVVDLKGVHPDDSFSRVPYEKGSLFLRYLEDLMGGQEVFDDFLRSYLTKFRKQSLDTDQFKAYLMEYFKNDDRLKNVDWQAWLDKSGMPPIIPDYDTTMTKEIVALVAKLDSPKVKFSYGDVKKFTPHQMIHFLQQLLERPPMSVEHVRSMGKAYKVDSSKNTEIQYRWLRLCVKSKDDSKLSEVFNFVNSNGRMKYVRPLYRDLYAWEAVRDQAIDNFLKNEKNMMHVSAYTLRKDLHLSVTSV